jgi:hypothetical protein
MSQTPTDIAQAAVDAAGSDVVLDDLEEGTREAQVVLRQYKTCLMQLLRGAMWNFARKQAPMVLLADATGQTPNVGATVIRPWTYEYIYPGDCVKARFVPHNFDQNVAIPPGNLLPYALLPTRTATSPSTNDGSNFDSDFGPPPTPNAAYEGPIVTPLSGPLYGGMISANTGARLRPARFLEATDFNYPPASGEDWSQTQGVSPQGRTVILTNVPNAELVYTALMLYPSTWDPLFREALIAYIAGQIALPLNRDKKLGMALRRENYAIAKQKIEQARIANGNEGITDTSHSVDWMRFRNSGWRGIGGREGEGGPGVFGYGWDSCGFEGTSNESAY